MKIAFVLNSLNKGGAERVVSLLSMELSKNHEVYIILFDNNISYKYGGTIVDIKCESVSGTIGKTINVFKRVKRLKAIFDTNKFDKIFAFMESAYLAAILTGHPIIASIRNNPKVYSKLITKYILPKAKCVVSVSKEIEKLLKNLNIHHVITIQNPIIIDKDYKQHEDLSSYQPFLLAVGRLHKQKNFSLLIRSFEEAKANSELKLLIVGEGSEKDTLKNLIHELKLENKVFLLGQKDNIQDYYRQCEMFVLSSKYEGFPNVLIEALSNKCPSISTNCPTGPSEILHHGYNGLLVDNNDKLQLTNAIDTLYFSHNLKKQFRTNSLKSISHLTLDKVAKEWLAL